MSSFDAYLERRKSGEDALYALAASTSRAYGAITPPSEYIQTTTPLYKKSTPLPIKTTPLAYGARNNTAPLLFTALPTQVEAESAADSEAHDTTNLHETHVRTRETIDKLLN